MTKDKEETIKDLVQDYEGSLLRIQQRLYLIEAVEKAWSNKLEGETFTVKHPHMWQMYLDTYDMLVNDLTSFIKAIHQKGGFFGMLQHHTKDLRIPSKRKISPPKGTLRSVGNKISKEDRKRILRDIDNQYIAEEIDAIKRCLGSLFPRLNNIQDIRSKEYKVKNEDIKALKSRYLFNNHPLIHYRNSTSGHRYENIHIRKRFIGGPSIEELREVVNSLEMLFNNIRMSFERSSFGYTDLSIWNVETIADDMTDMILLGPVDMVVEESINKSSKNEDERIHRVTQYSQSRMTFWEDFKIKEPKKDK